MTKALVLFLLLLLLKICCMERPKNLLVIKHEMALKHLYPTSTNMTTYKEMITAQKTWNNFFAWGMGFSLLGALGAKLGCIPTQTIGIRTYVGTAVGFGLFLRASRKRLNDYNDEVEAIAHKITDARAKEYADKG